MRQGWATFDGGYHTVHYGRSSSKGGADNYRAQAHYILTESGKDLLASL